MTPLFWTLKTLVMRKETTINLAHVESIDQYTIEMVNGKSYALAEGEYEAIKTMLKRGGYPPEPSRDYRVGSLVYVKEGDSQ